MVSSFRPVSHVIFDMDGVLLDSEPLYNKAIQNVVGLYGKTWTWEIKAPMMGLKRTEAAEYVVRALDLPITHEEYMAQMQIQYKMILVNAELFPAAKRLVYHLSRNNVPISVATASSPDSFELKTTKHKDFLKLFDHVVGGGDPEVVRGKPSPDIFLISASRFADHPRPDKCLVVEDSPNGVQAALNAGMQVIMVPDEHLPIELRQGATLMVTSLDNVPLEKFGLPPFPRNPITCASPACCKNVNI